MRIYLLRDEDPRGGYLCAQNFKPDMSSERLSINEVRVVNNFPEDVWDMVLKGGLPIDEDFSNDSTWLPWWAEAETIWTR
jgi:hypothetical protein